MATNENLPPNVVKRLARELKNLNESPQEGIKVIINDDDFSMIFADIDGPTGTPYENGLFRMKLVLSPDFPHTPPKGYFLTKIFHPNISSNGEICVNTLKKDWNPNLGFQHVLAVIRCLLIEPYPESALNEQAGKILLEKYDEYARLARLYTSIHALKPKSKLNKEPSSISESPKALNINNLKSSSTPKVPNAIPVFGHTSTELLENDGQNENTNAVPKKVTLSQVGVVTIQKKGVGDVNTKVQGDKRKIDARKKSLRRL